MFSLLHLGFKAPSVSSAQAVGVACSRATSVFCATSRNSLSFQVRSARQACCAKFSRRTGNFYSFSLEPVVDAKALQRFLLGMDPATPENVPRSPQTLAAEASPLASAAILPSLKWCEAETGSGIRTYRAAGDQRETAIRNPWRDSVSFGHLRFLANPGGLPGS